MSQACPSAIWLGRTLYKGAETSLGLEVESNKCTLALSAITTQLHPEVFNMSLLSWLATANQPAGIKSPSSPDLESDLAASW